MTSPVLTSVLVTPTGSAPSSHIREASGQKDSSLVEHGSLEYDSFEHYTQTQLPFSLVLPPQPLSEPPLNAAAPLSMRGHSQAFATALPHGGLSNLQPPFDSQTPVASIQVTEIRGQTPAFLSVSQQALNQSQLVTQNMGTPVQSLDSRSQTLPLTMATSLDAEMGNIAATNSSFPLMSGTIKPDNFTGFNPFQGINTPFSTTLSASTLDSNTSNAIDSVNQILTTSSRTQGAVAQWGPVSVSQSAPLPQQSHEMLSPLREQLRFQIDQQIKQAELRLDPPELGKIELNVRLDGDRLHIQMHAANSSVRDALLMGLDRLRAELAMDHGGQIDVDISQGEPQQKQHQGRSQSAIAAANLHEPQLVVADLPQQDQVDLLA
ncbi:flagellar hook-length control protein [Shewanella halifaxensis HAW-EB4]|uniref:Flagellar hook-length control protein n=1 Tax=Shewanella halifaxensis (strain HAW-EB4) TaxID=458817 RepID=B0TPK3_SHEHH|nr:flagellar hook-length control protein FliK [Shewanella halifaxensis]ABZ78804.1 flagellar hook-length control protein [Shewanella halifaxensis HAW-EB4]